MNKIIDWIKNNKVAATLIVVVAYLLFKGNLAEITPFSKNYIMNDEFVSMESAGAPTSLMMGRGVDTGIMPYNPVTPQIEVQDRMIVTNASASVVVKDVKESINGIKAKAEELEGYMVNSTINQPSEGGNGYLTVRVPSDALNSMLSYLRENSIKVVSENVYGNDVTDEYVDVDERLAILDANKAKMEKILDAATDVDDILRVQNSIFQIQSQIENLQGRLKFLEATSKTSSLSINLGTDEYALPYTPQDSWDIGNVFKLAVRSLVVTFRGAAEWLVWAVVYAPIWIPVAGIAYFVYRRSKKSSDISA